MVEIPDDAWGSRDSALSRVGQRFAATKPGSWTIRKLMPLDRRILVRSEGRRTVLGPIGAPTMLLETTGRKSGRPRVSPLLFARDRDTLVVVGSNFGQEHHPAWTGNLIADPEAVAVVRGQRIPVRARLLEGEEAEAAYRRMIEVTSVYAAYRTRTDRAIRVFRLTPV
ncbi:MAG: nitroreductase family deazaflavin-dependent oxidoreductase [Nocardioidaceae bacterium]|nr:nitroreductase family deazaflavin-dependent oxidoreductase [Nocardioidaceae bacterium]